MPIHIDMHWYVLHYMPKRFLRIVVCIVVFIEFVLSRIDIEYIHNTNPIHANTRGMY